MKVLIFGQAAYRHLPPDFAEHYDSVVTPPYHELVEPAKMHASHREFVDELVHGARAGFDGVSVSEHSQTTFDVSPNPNLVAAIIAYMTQAEGLPAAINVLGRSMGKSREPLKIAEEYAVLDVLSGGRLIAGLPVGLSYDANVNAGVPPIETRARARECRALIERAWASHEPFAWNGRFSRYPFVNIWPRPVQQPRPPIWVPGTGTPSTLVDILDRGDVFTFLSWFGVTLTGRRIFDRFWKLAEERGVEPNPHRAAFLQTVCVADTDAEAERLYATHIEQHFRNSIGSVPAAAHALPGYLEPSGIEQLLRDPGDLGLGPRMRTISYRELVETRAVICGGPATVREQITEIVTECRIGNLLVMLQFGSMPHELALYNIDAFASEVLPHLRGVWSQEDWPHRWWPTGIAEAAPARGGLE